MNWFERYGITGLYFVGLLAGWAYTSYPQTNILQPAWIAALIAMSLPIGYMISIFSQVMYLNWRRCCFRIPRLRQWLGFHGAAMDRLGLQEIRDEAIIEARTLLLTASSNGALSVETQRYMRDWISRRMDVVAINQSIIWATFLAVIIAFIFWRASPCYNLFSTPSLISVIVILAMFFSILVLRRQVIEVIAGIYRT